MDILVLSPCSKDKRYDSVLDCEAVDTNARADLVQEYSDTVATAADMYTGGEHEQVKAAVSQLREVANVDWCIISAGFGLLREDTHIPSYECGFSKKNIEPVRSRAERAGYDVRNLTNDETIRAVGREKRIPQEFRETISQGYDLLFVILSESYLLSVADALTDIPDQTTAFAVASNGSKHLIGGCHWIPATDTERQALGTTWMELRGREFRRIAATADSQELQALVQEPERAVNRVHREAGLDSHV